MFVCRIATAFLALSWSAALAAEVEVRSTTLIGGRPDVTDGEVRTVGPIYERVGLRVRNLQLAGIDELGLVVDAWGGLILPGSDGTVGASDVNLAYIEGKLLKKRLRLRVGRQFVVGGVARASYFDGLFAEYRSNLGLGISAYTGIPVERRFSNFTRGDFVAGTRAYWAPSTRAELGVSYVHLLKRGALARQDVGLDGRWQPVRSLRVAGSVIWSIADARLAEVDIGPHWSPTENLEVLLTYRRTAPELFLPLTSIFTVFADTTRDELGGSVAWQLHRALSLYGDARLLWLNGEQGFDAGVRIGFQPLRTAATTVTALFHRLEIPSNGYHQARVGARHTLPWGLGLAIDLEAYALDRPIRGQKLSFSASTTATYKIGRSWLIGLTLFGATTPTFESRYEVVAKLGYVFSAGAL